MARGSKSKARRKPVPKKRRVRVPGARLERPAEGPSIRSSARKTRGFEESPRDNEEYLH